MASGWMGLVMLEKLVELEEVCSHFLELLILFLLSCELTVQREEPLEGQMPPLGANTANTHDLE